MKRELAIVLIAVWMAGGIFTMLVATQNFHTIDRLLETKPNPAFSDLVESIGETKVRKLLRYLSSELNRLYFQVWGICQLVLGLVLVWLVHESQFRRIRYGVLAILTVTVVLALAITPSILSIGRALDFVPRDPVPHELKTFGILHGLYASLEFIKLLMTGVVAFWLQKN